MKSIQTVFANRILQSLIAFTVTAVLLPQDVRLLGSGYIPFGLSSMPLYSSVQVGVASAIMGILTAAFFGFGVFKMIRERGIALLVTAIGILVLGFAVFAGSWSALSF